MSSHINAIPSAQQTTLTNNPHKHPAPVPPVSDRCGDHPCTCTKRASAAGHADPSPRARRPYAPTYLGGPPLASVNSEAQHVNPTVAVHFGPHLLIRYVSWRDPMAAQTQSIKTFTLSPLFSLRRVDRISRFRAAAVCLCAKPEGEPSILSASYVADPACMLLSISVPALCHRTVHNAR
ncbi:hypothetical protein B0H67DRAFT_551401 [Lasiosphaeris hirsuta]|uniref:Uncharacterized protein n=1 Tax=Lasiosphaeris hirsuta TaxID=260670 RepID=A0AA40E853_9PEZI|nr:hypothetical protein B0H67DRAFT_551401 [Lasiosphaeris hirsuta]